MRAKWLVLMLCIGLMCYTGFSATTADLTKNSTAEIDCDCSESTEVVSVNVVTSDFAVQLDEAGTESVFTLHSIQANEANLFPLTTHKAAPVNLTKEDFKVGWQHIGNDNSTNQDHNLNRNKDPDELSLLYS